MENEGFKEYVRDQLMQRVKEKLPLIEPIAETLDPSNIDREFSREELECAF